MLKKCTFILFLSVISICVNAQEGWFKQKVSDKVTINFPIEPKKLNEQSYGGKGTDGVVYVVSSVDLLKATGMALADFNTQVKTQEFADEFMSGLTPTMSKFTFMSAKITTLKSNTAYYVTGRDETNKTTIYMNIVFVDGTGHSITSIVPDGKSTKNTDIFLTNIFISK